jgi:hypothetical protein
MMIATTLTLRGTEAFPAVTFLDFSLGTSNDNHTQACQPSPQLAQSNFAQLKGVTSGGCMWGFSPTLLVGKYFDLLIRWPLYIHLNDVGRGSYAKCTPHKVHVYSACAPVNIRDL